ncbi:MAG: hypothetical protein PHC51_01955 [bacterium]|nr:hypothetical protein [bacterium]
MWSISPLYKDKSCAVYGCSTRGKVNTFITSSAESRRICNDSLFVGVNYTDALKTACQRILSAESQFTSLPIAEDSAVVLNILRGGLNFGLREALAQAHGWNRHASAFISAQRVRETPESDTWHITEADYRKIQLPPVCDLVFGDVVATGTSLRHGLKLFLSAASEQGTKLRSIRFFTIGGDAALNIISEVEKQAIALFPDYQGTALYFLEGCFSVANKNSNLHITIPGTDLLRRESLMAEEFIASQGENPAYPIERCAIYDAGSRAFFLPEYLEDVRDYWQRVYELGEKGMTYQAYLDERFPALGQISAHGDISLIAVANEMLERINKLAS